MVGILITLYDILIITHHRKTYDAVDQPLERHVKTALCEPTLPSISPADKTADRRDYGCKIPPHTRSVTTDVAISFPSRTIIQLLKKVPVKLYGVGPELSPTGNTPEYGI